MPLVPSLRLIGLAALAAAMLAACGGDPPTPSPTPPTTPSPTETPTAPPPTSTPTAAPTTTSSPTATPTEASSATPSPTPTTPTTATPSPTHQPTATPTPTPDEPPEPVEPDDPTPAVRPSLPQSPVFDGPPGVYTDITVGASHACALTRDGEAVCWDIESGEVWNTPPGTYTFIETEGDDTCAISDEGAIVCWPAGGGPFPEERPDPSRDARPGRYQAFSWASDEYYIKGLTHACGVTDGGEAVCWTSQEPETDYSHELALPDLPPGEYTTVDVRYSFFGWGQESLTVCALTRAKSAFCSQTARAQGACFRYRPGRSRVPMRLLRYRAGIPARSALRAKLRAVACLAITTRRAMSRLVRARSMSARLPKQVASCAGPTAAAGLCRESCL